jgi:hypothetical protein
MSTSGEHSSGSQNRSLVVILYGTGCGCTIFDLDEELCEPAKPACLPPELVGGGANPWKIYKTRCFLKPWETQHNFLLDQKISHKFVVIYSCFKTHSSYYG